MGGGSIVRKTPDTALYVLCTCKYFVACRHGFNAATSPQQMSLWAQKLHPDITIFAGPCCSFLDERAYRDLCEGGAPYEPRATRPSRLAAACPPQEKPWLLAPYHRLRRDVIESSRQRDVSLLGLMNTVLYMACVVVKIVRGPLVMGICFALLYTIVCTLKLHNAQKKSLNCRCNKLMAKCATFSPRKIMILQVFGEVKIV